MEWRGIVDVTDRWNITDWMRPQLDGRMREAQVVPVVVVMERCQGRGKHIEVGRVLDTQVLRRLEAVHEDRLAAVDTVSEAVQDLPARRVLEVPGQKVEVSTWRKTTG